MFFGEKLRSIRELKGLSRKELAGQIGVSEQAVWQYENQYIIPKFEVVNKLKKIFHVKSQFFFTEPFIASVSRIENIAYRADTRDSRKKAKMETIYIDFIEYFLNQFESKLEHPFDQIRNLRHTSLQMYYQSKNKDRTQIIEQIAANAREVLGVENNKELLYKLELSGIYILEKNMGNRIDAYSTWITTDKAFIILGNRETSGVRRNFDLAHELGHLLMHFQVDMDTLTKDEFKQIEKEANDFASFFLLPEKQFLEDFADITRKSNPLSYQKMKVKYQVSLAALEYRAFKLGLLTMQENRYFYATLNRLDFRKKEPLDDDIFLVRPGKIRALLDLIFKNNLLNLSDMLDDYQIDQSFLASLLGIEDSFFDKYKEQSLNRSYYDSDKIINLHS